MHLDFFAVVRKIDSRTIDICSRFIYFPSIRPALAIKHMLCLVFMRRDTIGVYIHRLPFQKIRELEYRLLRAPERAKTLEVRLIDARNDAPIRLHKFAELLYIAGIVFTEFKDENFFVHGERTHETRDSKRCIMAAAGRSGPLPF